MKTIVPILSSLFGLFLTISLLIAMNSVPPKKERTLSENRVQFSIEAPPPPVTKSSKPKPRRVKSAPPPPPLPMMNANLSGLSFGMDALEDQLVVKGEDLLGVNQDVVMTSETVDIPPRAKSRISPEYPTTARRKGIEGYVTLSLLINDSGHVEDIVIVESHPSGIFEQSAKDTVLQWSFAPGEYQGQPVSVRVMQVLRYSLG